MGLSSWLELDRLDAKLDQVLTVTVLPLRVVLAALLLENDDLLAARLAEDSRHHRCASDSRSADFRRVSADHQHFAECDFVFVCAAEDIALDAQKLAFS